MAGRARRGSGFGRAVMVLAALIVIAAAGVFVFLRGDEPESSPTPPPATATTVAFTGDPAAVERGSQIFAVNCASCHGTGARGDGPAAATLSPKPVDLTSAMHRMHPDSLLAQWITNGVPGSAMPAFEAKLTSSEIADVVTFIRSLQAAAPPAAAIDIPGPEECTIEPKPPSAFLPEGTASPKPAPTSQPDVGTDGFTWPQGELATNAEIEGITRTIREFHACANAGDYPRRLALYSDRAIRPQFEALDAAGWQNALNYAATPAAVVPEGQRGWIETISNVRRLPDGRVGAYIGAVDPINHPHQVNAVVIFAKTGERWLIDEVHRDPLGLAGPSGTPAAPRVINVPTGDVGTTLTSGGLLVTMVEVPQTFGMGRYVIEITDVQGNPVSDATVTVEIDMPEMGMGVQAANAELNDDGQWVAETPMGMPGDWQALVIIERADQPRAIFAFNFVVP